jgi:hypothetical protein
VRTDDCRRVLPWLPGPCVGGASNPPPDHKPHPPLHISTFSEVIGVVDLVGGVAALGVGIYLLAHHKPVSAGARAGGPSRRLVGTTVALTGATAVSSDLLPLLAAQG